MNEISSEKKMNIEKDGVKTMILYFVHFSGTWNTVQQC
jgi:hypothetical protein